MYNKSDLFVKKKIYICVWLYLFWILDFIENRIVTIFLCLSIQIPRRGTCESSQRHVVDCHHVSQRRFRWHRTEHVLRSRDSSFHRNDGKILLKLRLTILVILRLIILRWSLVNIVVLPWNLNYVRERANPIWWCLTMMIFYKNYNTDIYISMKAKKANVTVA